MINQQRRDDKKHYKVFYFEFENNRIENIRECKSNDEMYDKNKPGFYRRVNVSSYLSRQIRDEVFEDRFQIDFGNS